MQSKVYWLDMGMLPTYFGFTTSEAAYLKTVKSLGADNPYPFPRAGACMSYRNRKGKLVSIVLLNMKCRPSREQQAGLIAHECAHAFQQIRRDIGEDNPSDEFEAYTIQYMVQFCLHHLWRKR